MRLAFLGIQNFLLLTISVNALTYPDGSTPKFFICPQGMTRFATVVTTKHDLNVCGQELGSATLLALRTRGKRDITNASIVKATSHVYVARSSNGTVYTLDTRRQYLLIQPKNGKTIQEKVVASD